MKNLNPGELLLSGAYELVVQVRGCVGGELTSVGSTGVCRFCGQSGKALFRKKAHTFPEALGNKWVISRDECDMCNHAFSAYESALVTAVSPFLALGGVPGKKSRDRQVGLSDGPRLIRHSMTNGKRDLSIVCKEPLSEDIGPRITPDGSIRVKLPVAATPFKPRLAYKALAKMGVALLPNDELNNFRRLRAWILDADDRLRFRSLDVALSFSSVGNSPELICGTLLKRVRPHDSLPYMLFIFCAGSVCFQIALMPDYLDGHLKDRALRRVGIGWKSIVQDATGRSLVFDYGAPMYRDWSSADSQPQPVEYLWFEFNARTREGRLVPIFRSSE